MVEGLLADVQSVTLVEGRKDKWLWKPCSEGLYTVKSAFTFLQDMDMEDPIPVLKEFCGKGLHHQMYWRLAGVCYGEGSRQNKA